MQHIAFTNSVHPVFALGANATATQNSLFNSALRQSTAIRKDLDALAAAGSASPALQGQISASLASFSRTVDEYNKLAKQELVEAKQEKAYERVKTFRAEITEYRASFERIKTENDERVCLLLSITPLVCEVFEWAFGAIHGLDFANATHISDREYRKLCKTNNGA